MMMKPAFRNAILSAAAAATCLAAIPAEAGPRWHHRDRVVVRQDGGGDLLAAGIIGLAAGVIVGGIVAGSQQPAPVDANPYRHPRPQPDRDYFPPAPAAYQDDHAYGPRGAEPWSREWYRYCSARYRSFDPATGTFTTFGGEQRFCVAE
jgi:hypothetical protein